jgi:mannose-6-phosphate isomerase-like protein (cupin superfamily)
MTLRASDSYLHLVEKAQWSHAHGLDVFHIHQTDIDAARLFSYGYRAQTIGAFHATRVAIEAEESKADGTDVRRLFCQARDLLRQLQATAMDCIPRDFRALVSTLYYYDQWTNQVDGVLEEACTRGSSPRLEVIRQRFSQRIEPVKAGNGIYVARDSVLPEQGAYIVPNLGISIVPVIYGDHHSWNAAFVTGDQAGVAVHRHKKGAEIHLGFSPVRGRTVLGSCYSEVHEGYAMPIPPMTDHGFVNASNHDHVLPFIFGSLIMSGWGVFFDVEARFDENVRKEHSLESAAMNQSVFLDRAIRRMAAAKTTEREVLIPAERAGSPEIGGLQLAVTHVGPGEFEYNSEHYRIVSVQSGRGRTRIGSKETEVTKHDHFGIPADMNCNVASLGGSPLVILDAMILPVVRRKTGLTLRPQLLKPPLHNPGCAPCLHAMVPHSSSEVCDRE